MSNLQLRTIAPHERGRVLDLLKEWLNDRAFFARYFEHDPSFRDDLCFVACDGERIVSTLQVFRKQVRIGAAVLQVGCVGNVFTTEAYRQRGLASQLLQQSIAAMQQHGFDLSLLFATRLKFYGDHGWRSHPRHLVFLPPGAEDGQAAYRLELFSDSQLDIVADIYDRYAERFSGTTVRDRKYWRGQLKYAGNPHEDFLVAWDNEKAVAYARGTTLYNFYVITEHAYLPGHSAALTQLVHHLHAVPGGALPGTITHLGIEPGVLGELRNYAIESRLVEDVFWMWRVIHPTQLAAKLGVDEPELDAEDFLFRILPPQESVYFTADRF